MLQQKCSVVVSKRANLTEIIFVEIDENDFFDCRNFFFQTEEVLQSNVALVCHSRKVFFSCVADASIVIVVLLGNCFAKAKSIRMLGLGQGEAKKGVNSAEQR